MASESKRFEDWVKVDCNDCAKYWDSSCDGPQGPHRPCNSYLATRSVVIPAKLKSLEKRVRWLEFAIGITCVIVGIYMLVVR